LSLTNELGVTQSVLGVTQRALLSATTVLGVTQSAPIVLTNLLL
jgi:hypothetical protein